MPWRTGLLLASLLGVAALPAVASPPRIAGGAAGGAYQRLAERVAERLDGRVVASEGSIDSLALLAAGRADFALVQQDVVSRFAGSAGGPPVWVVDRVFFDYLHLLVRRPLHLATVRELRGLRIWLGPPDSGTRFTARRFLDIVGIAPPAYEEVAGLDLVDLRDALGDGDRQAAPAWPGARVDVAMVVAAPGSPAICELTRERLVDVLAVDHPTRRRMAAESSLEASHSQMVFASIPAGTYPGQPEPVPTLAVPVLLLTSLGPDASAAVAEVRRVVKEEWRALVEQSRDDTRTSRSATSAAAACPYPALIPRVGSLAEANLPLYGEGEPAIRLWSRLRVLEHEWRPLVVLLVVVAAAWWLSRSRWGGSLRQMADDHSLLFATVVAVASVLLITLLTYLAEHDLNENFQSIPESFWSITVYLFSGLEDRTPYTGLGKGLAALGLLLGPALFALLTGHSAKYFISKERTMPRHLTGHILLLNWNERALQLAEEIHNPVVTSGHGHAVIVAVTDRDDIVQRLKDESKSRELKVMEDVYISVGDPTEERALRSANAHDASTILILSDDRLGERADERTIRSIFMLRRIARAESKKDMHVVAEIVDPANEVVVDELAEDFPGLLERVCGVRVRTCLIAQAALSPGIVEFYSDLLRVSADSNEVYARPIPASAVGTTFRNYAASILSNGGSSMIPVGVQRTSPNGGRPRMYCNPRDHSAGAVLQENDQLVFIAYDSPAGPLPEMVE